MGYNLYIGEAEPVIYLEDRHARMGVANVDGKELGAPLNSSDNYSNCCWPSYTGWANFAKAVGLYSVFFAPRCPNCAEKFPRHQGCDLCVAESGRKRSVWWIPEGKKEGEGQEGLICRHPGAEALTEDHLVAFRTAREGWLARSEEERKEGRGEDGEDYVLRRLDWLIFWTDWALKNCEYPTFANS